MVTRTIIVGLLSFVFLSANAQRNATHTVEFSSTIKKLIVDSEKGITYIKEDSKLSGFSNDMGKTIWEIDKDKIGAKDPLKRINQIDISALGKDNDAVDLVPGSDYVFANINDRDLVINGLTGEVLFNSERDMSDGIIVKQMFLPYDNAFVFLTKSKKDFSIKCFDLNSKKISWDVSAGTDASFASMFSKSQQTREDRAESFKDNVYALANNRLFNVDTKTGKLIWVLEGINKFFICQNGTDVIIMKNEGGLLSSKQSLNIVNKDSGKNLWKDNIETKRFITLQDWKEKILIAHTKGFNFYNLSDGSKVWKKDIKGSDFKQVLPLGEDFLYVAENEMILIDKNGKDKWKNSIEISDDKEDLVHYLDKTKSGKVMYITGTYGNMVDYVTGKKLWKRNIKFNPNRPLLYAYDEVKDVFLIYNDEDLYRFDPNINDKPEPFAKVNAKSDKTMAGIELFDWGVSLTSQSEVIGVGSDGKVLFQKQYEQPGEEERKLMKLGGDVTAGAFGARASLKKGFADATVTVTYVDEKGVSHNSTSYMLNESSRQSLNASANKDVETAAMVGALTKNFGTRFNALKQNSEYAFLFAIDKSNDKNQKVLIKVSKRNGEEVDKIIIQNNKPLYDIDASSNSIYYGNGQKLLIYK
jgi:outer membrane protein assembly factor BamB